MSQNLKNTLDLLVLFSSKQTYSFVFLTLKSSFRVNILGNLTTSLTSQMLVWSIFCQKDKRKKKENADDKYCFWTKITLCSQKEGYTRLLIFMKFSTLPAVI